MTESLAWADVFLHAAVSEGFCVSAIEAQAMALPVVCTDADGLAENVADGESGFVVPRRDPAALAGALLRLVRDPRLVATMGEAACRRARAALDADGQLDAFDRLYEEMLGRAADREARPEVTNGRPSTDRGLHRVEALDSPGEPRRPEATSTLRAHLARLESHAEALRGNLARREEAARAVSSIVASVPDGARVLVVSRGDDDLVELPGRTGYHFPMAPGGGYAGYHPADSRDAIEHLEQLRAIGAEYIAFPSPSLWWLEHYAELREFLESSGRETSESASPCKVFALVHPGAEHTPTMDHPRGHIATA